MTSQPTLNLVPQASASPMLAQVEPIVQVENGVVTTTSIEVARVFEKQHKHVLRDIRNLLLDIPKNNQSNFGLVEYTDEKGEVRPCYHITRDGFTLLAMGFTGKKAVHFKLAYIDAFQRAEDKIRSQFNHLNPTHSTAQEVRSAMDFQEVSEILPPLPIAIQDIRIAQANVPTVNARELHTFLLSGDKFSDWIQNRVRKYDFIENQDFVIASGNTEAMRGGQNRKDYYLTLDMAKELSMVERNVRGKQARQYFIACEQRAKQQAVSAANILTHFNTPTTMPDALRLAADLMERNTVLKYQVAEQQPKIEALERIANSDGSMCMRDSAKVLQIRPVDLKNWLVLNRWIYGRPGHSGWLAYQDRIQQGVLCHKVHTKVEADGNERTFEQVRITSKGLTRIGESLSRIAA